jgi:hypothetical protein
MWVISSLFTSENMDTLPFVFSMGDGVKRKGGDYLL